MTAKLARSMNMILVKAVCVRIAAQMYVAL